MLIYFAMNLRGVTTGDGVNKWNIKNVFHAEKLKKRNSIERKNLLRLAVAFGFTTEETRALMFQILEGKRAGRFQSQKNGGNPLLYRTEKRASALYQGNQRHIEWHQCVIAGAFCVCTETVPEKDVLKQQ
ncbi:MAG: hypothetical protein ACLUSL_00375 [Ruminococcus sp.]